MLFDYTVADEELECGGDSQEREGCSGGTGGFLRLKDSVCITGGRLFYSKLQQAGSSITIVSHCPVFVSPGRGAGCSGIANIL